MSSRKLWYVIGVCLLAVVCSAPQILFGFSIMVQVYQNGSLSTVRHMLPKIPGLGPTAQYYNRLFYAPFWHDQFISVVPESGGWKSPFVWKVNGISPETGEESDLHVRMTDRNWVQPVVAGHRLWLVGPYQSYEVVDGVTVPCPMRSGLGQTLFLWNGEPAFVNPAAGSFQLLTFTGGTWTATATVVCPASDRSRSVGQRQINFGSVTSIDCRQHGERLHVFATVNGHLLHKEGLETKASRAAMVGTVAPGFLDEPVSALRPENTDADLEGWSLICFGVGTMRHAGIQGANTSRQACGMIVEGQPAALVVDNEFSDKLVGHIYRFDGTTWSVVATQEFPFGTHDFRTFVTEDGQRTYILAATSTGGSQMYAVEATGIRQTNGSGNETNPALQALSFYVILPSIYLGFGSVLGLILWLMMWLSTKPDYSFGKQNVKLGSLGGRGLARLIDMGLIAVSTIAVGWAITIGFDWVVLLEALNLHVDHPAVRVAARVALILVAWMTLIVGSMVISQSLWGVTPGKWLCRLRTVRTSLRPCGFVASFTREVTFLFDCCGFACWAPGILCIVFTDNRQRLGDIVADTIVVDARTLNERSLWTRVR